MNKKSIRFYKDHEVRAVWDEEKSTWWFSIVDIVGAITDSPNPRKYWSVLKARLKKAGNELTTHCSQLKMTAADGKRYATDYFADEDVWLTREQLGEIYTTTTQNISLHVGNIYQDGELDENATRKKFFLVRQEGKRQVQREIDHYNLDMIIALGYRVQSPIAVRFRRATSIIQ